MPELRPGECWFDAGDGSGPCWMTTIPMEYSVVTGWSVNGQPVLWVVDEIPSLIADAIADRISGGSRQLTSSSPLDQSSPDTSQEYFLDLIARIDDATDDRRSS